MIGSTERPHALTPPRKRAKRGVSHIRRRAWAGNPYEWPEVIAPGAFDAHLPAEVPLTDKPGGKRIGTAKVSKDATGVTITMTVPGSDGEITGHITTGD